jgi:PAS domain S-box-containing protein
LPRLATHHLRACQLAAMVTVLYGVLGVVWILWSDAAVQAVSADPAWHALAQRGKGLAFVALTALALALLVYQGAHRLLLAVQEGAHSALRVHDLFEGHPQPMWYYHPDSLAFLRVNDAAVRLYGWTQAEFLQMAVPDLRPADERPALAHRLRSRAAGFSAVDQVRHRSKSGGWLDMQISAQAAVYQGRPAVLVLAVDISAQVAARQALQRQEQQIRELHQSLAEVLWLGSPDAKQVLYVSPAFEQVYGLPVDDFRCDPGLWLARVHPDDQALARASARQLWIAGSADCQYRIFRPDGEVRWLSDRKKLVRDAQGQVTMIAGIAEDITARRLDQDTLRRNSEELAARYAELARFNRAAVDRELDMIALKREVNALSQARQLPPPYRVDFAATAPEPVATP